MSKDAYVELAKRTIKDYTENGIKPVYEDIPEELLTNEAATFVSLKKDGQLRGCIGTLMPTQDNVAEEIIQNAISACSKDPRFSPVTKDELDNISYSVDVLEKPVLVSSIEELDPKEFGVIVRNGFRSGVLLPDLEGVDTVEDQLYIAMQKAGIDIEEPIEVEKFRVIRHVEGD